MAIYKNYIIKAEDTIERISSQYLGSSSLSDKIISLNRLRYPYIVRSKQDKYGLPKAESMLLSDLDEDTTSINMIPYTSSLLINPLVLTKKSVLYIKSDTKNGQYNEDELLIDQYYSLPQQNISAGTLTFDLKNVSSPTVDAESSELLDTAMYVSFTATITSGGIMTVTSVTSGYISVGMTLFTTTGITVGIISGSKQINSSGSLTGTGLTGTYFVTFSSSASFDFSTLFIGRIVSQLLPRKYFVQYTYIRTSQNKETAPSPFLLDEFRAAKPFIVQSGSTSSVFVFKSPIEWPDGATAINVYVGMANASGQLTSQSLLRHQTTLYSPDELYVEPISGLNFTSDLISSGNTAAIGTQHRYTKGTIFYIYENPEQSGTQILSPGDTLLLPILSGATGTAIFSAKKSNAFRSALGSDIQLTSNGQFNFSSDSGDFAVTSGIDNIKQALMGRLSTKIGALKSRKSFGNPMISMVGSMYSAGFLTSLKVELASALQQERRIYAVRDFQVTYNSKSSAVIINNLIVEIINDGQSSSVVTFDPIALPI